MARTKDPDKAAETARIKEMREALPPGWQPTLMARLRTLIRPGDAGGYPVLDQDQKEEIMAWVKGNLEEVPSGWVSPDDWRLRSLEALQLNIDFFSEDDFFEHVDEILKADRLQDLNGMLHPAQALELPSAPGVKREADAEADAGTGDKPSRKERHKPIYEDADIAVSLPGFDTNMSYADTLAEVNNMMIDGCRVRKSRTSSASGPNNPSLFIPLQCREHQKVRCS